MREFKLSAEQIERIKKKSLLNAIPLLLIALVAGFIIGNYNSGYSNMQFVLPLVIVVAAIAVVIGLRYGNKINNDTLASYKIELLDDSIKKYQKNAPLIEIYQSEVVSITEVENRGMTIKTNNSGKCIHIPVYVEGYSELKEALSQWMSITAGKKVNNQFVQYLTSIATILGLAVVMLCSYPYIVVPVGIALLIALLWSQIKIQKNKNVDNRIKKTSYAIILPIIMIVAKMIAVLL